MVARGKPIVFPVFHLLQKLAALGSRQLGNLIQPVEDSAKTESRAGWRLEMSVLAVNLLSIEGIGCRLCKVEMNHRAVGGTFLETATGRKKPESGYIHKYVNMGWAHDVAYCGLFS